MRTLRVYPLAAAMALTAATAVAAQQSFSVRAEISLSIARGDETIAIPW